MCEKGIMRLTPFCISIPETPFRSVGKEIRNICVRKEDHAPAKGKMLRLVIAVQTAMTRPCVCVVTRANVKPECQANYRGNA